MTYRWIVFLQSFDFSVIHRKGKDHINADSLSRARFSCKKHKVVECTSCVNNVTLDPYLEASPVEDQIFVVHDLLEVADNRRWRTEIQKDVILNEIRLWIFEH